MESQTAWLVAMADSTPLTKLAPSAGRLAGCSLCAVGATTQETVGKTPLAMSEAMAELTLLTRAMPLVYSGELVEADLNWVNQASGLSSKLSGSW